MNGAKKKRIDAQVHTHNDTQRNRMYDVVRPKHPIFVQRERQPATHREASRIIEIY